MNLPRGMKKEAVLKKLQDLQDMAEEYSQCKKVAVGSELVLRKAESVTILGFNRTFPGSCKQEGCHRVNLYGDYSKEHRLPSDCRAVHSEVDAIAQAAKFGLPTEGATLFVTRYPCEACARAIAVAGIKNVIYGRRQPISKETEDIFTEAKVKAYHIDDWSWEDTDF